MGQQAWWFKGKCKGGKGKEREGLDGAKGVGKMQAGPEEQRAQIRAIIDDRVATSGGNLRHKELQEELQRMCGVSAKRFRTLFSQNLAQYLAGLKGTVGIAGFMEKGEQDMRAQRAARFQHHLQAKPRHSMLLADRAAVAMVSFNNDEMPAVDGGPLVGELMLMCSREEAREREQTRQLDKLEWKIGTDPKHPEVNLALATKKYSRSSADKAYRSQDVRNLDSCWRTMEFLMTEILDFDCNPKANFAVQEMPYVEVYSYLRDRTRSCRVDLHLQQPRSTTQRTFVETHECCLRFEMLSFYLLTSGVGDDASSTEKYDTKLGLKAISQTIEPLLNAYQAVHDKQLARSILAEAMGGLLADDDGDAEEYASPWEPVVHRYVVLLLMAWSPEDLLGHLAKLSRELLCHPLVSFAIQAYAAFKADDYGRFLRRYRDADFLTAVAMSGVADLARLRALWLLMRSYPHPVGDKLTLSRIRNLLAFGSDEHAKSFLAFHGIRIVEDPGGAWVVLPKKGSPEAEANRLLTSGFPNRCEFDKSDSLLVAKFEALGLSRADIVFGGADATIVSEPEASKPEEELPDAAKESAATDAAPSREASAEKELEQADAEDSGGA